MTMTPKQLTDTWKKFQKDKTVINFQYTEYDAYASKCKDAIIRISIHDKKYRAIYSSGDDQHIIEISKAQYDSMKKDVHGKKSTIVQKNELPAGGFRSEKPKRTRRSRGSVAMIIMIIMIALSSCRVADFTMLSTKNVNTGETYTLKKERSVGRAMDLKTAVDRCIESGGGSYITNVVIYDTGLRYKVVGDVYGK